MASTTLRTASRSPTFDLSDVALLVPARNVAGVIEGTLNRIPTAISRRAGALIVRDDASFDSTADVARRWAARHLDLGALVIEDDTARGQAANTINACRDAAALGLRIAVILPVDASAPPERLGMVLRPLLEGRADVIVAPAPRPVAHPNAATRRLLAIRWNMATGLRIDDWHNQFRGYRLDRLGIDHLERVAAGTDHPAAVLRMAAARGLRVQQSRLYERQDESRRRPLERRFKRTDWV